MGVNDVQIPPIRTGLNDPNISGQTAKEWYFYWKQGGDRINVFNDMIGYGTHASRPAPALLPPDGALYSESDRSEVFYQYQNGAWHYVAGAMWGTLSPDQRPTDLGANDAGFTFRSVDTSSQYSARMFVWSGSLWVETTAAHCDTHANRLAVSVNNLENGTLWIETDRSEVIYQLQGGVWHYCAGTMWNTLSPDTRPGDLGANDAGFRFQTTDTTSGYAGRSFIWSGTLWVEVTAARFDSHANRVAQNINNIENGALWIETDRSEVIYQLQGSAWHFLAGTMWGTITPDNRPTDLGANDAGFTYRGTDVQRSFVWSGTVWVETTPPKLVSTQVQPARALGTVYHNTNLTPLFAAVTVRLQYVGTFAQAGAVTDASATPGTQVAQAANYAAGPDMSIPLFFVVLPGNYYEVTVGSGTVTLMNWTEWY